MPRSLTRLPFVAGRSLLGSALGRAAVKALRGSAVRPRTLLVLRLDGIGDYVLFRNFLAALRGSARYRGHHVTLCGNVLWRDLAETLDAGSVDRFEWVDTRAFQLELSARWDVLGRLAALGVETVLQPRHSREAALEDAIVSFLRGATAIGSAGDAHNLAPREKAAGDRLYAKLVAPPPGAVFEFERNRGFFERVLEQDLSHVRPHIDRARLAPQAPRPRPYAVIAPGAAEARRRWPPERFAVVCEHLLAETGLDVVICGGAADRPLGERIARGRASERVEDLTGRATLAQAAALIAGARVVVANDSAAVHLAAAGGTAVLCLSNGNHYGRFTEYPQRLATCVTTLYPPAVERLRGEPDALVARYARGSFEDIDAIAVARVIDVLRGLLEPR